MDLNHSSNMYAKVNSPKTFYARGAQHHNAKVSADIVRAIRNYSREITNRELSALYGISAAQVGNIRSRRAWCHII